MADRDMTIERLERELTALRTRLTDVESRLPPVGWQVVNYSSIANPGLSLVRDCITGKWSVWRYLIEAYAPVSEGATIAEAIKGIPRT